RPRPPRIPYTTLFRSFASEGARVVVADLSLERAAQVADGIGAGALALHLDAADEHACQEVVERTWREFGRIDILHNNHAWLTDGMPDDGTVVTTPFEVWDRTMAINLRGYFAMAKFAIPHM